jgi:hypothetical protein
MTNAVYTSAPFWAVDNVDSDLALAARLGGDRPVDMPAWRATVADACARAASDAAWADQRDSDGWQDSQPLTDADTAAIQAAYTSDLFRRTGLWWVKNPHG